MVSNRNVAELRWDFWVAAVPRIGGRGFEGLSRASQPCAEARITTPASSRPSSGIVMQK
jgi:hypothetical protein